MSEPSAISKESDQVKVKLKHGDWEVEITCNESRLKDVVQNVLSGMDSSIASDNDNAQFVNRLEDRINEMESRIQNLNSLTNLENYNTSKRSTQKIGITCRTVLELLVNDKYFFHEKPLGQIHEEISRRGYNYDRTAVSHSLTDMVRERILFRVGTIRNYRYIQKIQADESIQS
jgi:hypothetical protein